MYSRFELILLLTTGQFALVTLVLGIWSPTQMGDNRRRVRIDCYDDPLCSMNGINSPKGVNDSEYNHWHQQEVRLSKYDPIAEYDTWPIRRCAMTLWHDLLIEPFITHRLIIFFPWKLAMLMSKVFQTPPPTEKYFDLLASHLQGWESGSVYFYFRCSVALFFSKCQSYGPHNMTFFKKKCRYVSCKNESAR